MCERVALITGDSTLAGAEPNNAVGRAHGGDDVIIGQAVAGGEIYKVIPIEKRDTACGGYPTTSVESANSGENVAVDQTIRASEGLQRLASFHRGIVMPERSASPKPNAAVGCDFGRVGRAGQTKFLRNIDKICSVEADQAGRSSQPQDATRAGGHLPNGRTGGQRVCDQFFSFKTREALTAKPHSTIRCLCHRVSPAQSFLFCVVVECLAALLRCGRVVPRNATCGAKPPDATRLLAPEVVNAVVEQTVFNRQVGELLAIESRHAAHRGNPQHAVRIDPEFANFI